MTILKMPSFGADMKQGTVVEWRVSPGDRVGKGDTLALIETSKGIIDMEAFEELLIEQLLVPLGQECAVGTPIIAARAVDPASPVQPRIEALSQAPIEPHGKTISTEQPVSVPRPQGFNGRISPAARLQAWQQQLELDDVNGSGPQGAVVLNDLQALHPLPVPSADAAPSVRTSGFDYEAMRQAIAAVVSRSKREIPHYYLSLEVDLDRCQSWLQDYNAEVAPEQRLLINAPLMCAVAQALARQSGFNGHYQEQGFVAAEQVDLGVAIALRGQGLITPAIHGAETLSAAQMMQRFKALVERAKHGGLKQSELQQASVTLSNIGDRGCDQLFGVIFPPQVALIGIGKVKMKPVVELSETGEPLIEVRSRVNISLAADHRVTDGYSGARLLNEINKRLQRPESL